MNQQFLKDLYYAPTTGFSSIDKFYKKAVKLNPEIKYKDVENFLGKQYTYQINKETKKPRVFNTILANKVGDNFQIDIIIYDRYEIHRYKYILCVIDVNSRFAQCRAMTNRENDTILKELKDIFEVMGIPKNVNSDNEFNTKKINDYFNSLGIIKHYSEVGEINKNAIVERFNRTLAGLIQKWRVGTKKRDWYKALGELVQNYNDTFHRTVKQTPSDIFNGEKENRQFPIYQFDPIFNVGDIVRIKQLKEILGKGDYLKYSEDTYLITEQKGKRFKLQNTRTNSEEKRFYKDYELKKAETIESLVPPEEGVMEKDIDKLTKQNKKLKKVLNELQIVVNEKHLTKPLSRSSNIERETQLNKLTAPKIRALANKYQIEGRINELGRYASKQILVNGIIAYEKKHKIIV